MRRQLTLLAVVVATLAIAACTSVTTEPKPACPVFNGSESCGS